MRTADSQVPNYYVVKMVEQQHKLINSNTYDEQFLHNQLQAAPAKNLPEHSDLVIKTLKIHKYFNKVWGNYVSFSFPLDVVSTEQYYLSTEFSYLLTLKLLIQAGSQIEAGSLIQAGGLGNLF